MSDLPTLEAAMRLADQDSPLPSLAGPALKVLRKTILDAAERLTHISYKCDRVSVGDTEYRIDRVVDLLKGKWSEGSTDSTTLTSLIAELRAREAVGRKKYGADVDRSDLTNAQWRQHLREELMDALLYSLAEERTQPVEVGGCWCLTCEPKTWTNRLFVVCPTCGNKRCPHANDHRNACTGSNAVGQSGSSWEHVKSITSTTDKDC